MSRSRMTILGVAVLLAATPAYAHFTLDAPGAITTQNVLGDPQKDGPCGALDLEGSASNTVNPDIMTGSMLTVTISETVNHGGHYRVSLAQDPAGLPAEPPVTADQQSDCGSTPIDANPTLPVLADGLFPTATIATSPVSSQVQLPAGMQCQNCVLQVLEFMTNHGAPCFYHHCARVNIVDNPAPPADGGLPGSEAGVDPGDDAGVSSGCCSTNRGAPGAALLGLLVLGALFLPRRRR